MIYPDTYYSQTAIAAPNHKPLNGTIETDICIIGGGLAGLSCAQELLKMGKKVVLLEAHKIAWGASGRNGGIVFPGFARGQNYIEQKLGLSGAQKMFELSLEGVEMVRQNIDNNQLSGVAKTSGILSLIRYDDSHAVKSHCDDMLEKYNYPLDYVDREKMTKYSTSQRYYQGSMDKNAFHFHPLNYCLGVAQLISQQGGHIFEDTEVTRMQLEGTTKSIYTPNGIVKAEHVVLCGGGYSGQVYGKVSKSILPIATYVITTEKLGERVAPLVKTQAAIIDDRMASDYYRIVDDDRLLWGGRITAKTSEPKRLADLMKADMLSVYPALKHVKIDMAWTGLMAYARHRMPYIGQVQPNVWSCTAFGGHGMNTAPIGGRIIAEAITKQSDRYKLFEKFSLQWNGGMAGPYAAQATYWGMKLHDWWQETQSKR
ncbi:MAG: FAD-binding oxidoreductase [Hyphomicrobiales bacterium]